MGAPQLEGVNAEGGLRADSWALLGARPIWASSRAETIKF